MLWVRVQVQWAEVQVGEQRTISLPPPDALVVLIYCCRAL